MKKAWVSIQTTTPYVGNPLTKKGDSTGKFFQTQKVIKEIIRISKSGRNRDKQLIASDQEIAFAYLIIPSPKNKNFLRRWNILSRR